MSKGGQSPKQGTTGRDLSMISIGSDPLSDTVVGLGRISYMIGNWSALLATDKVGGQSLSTFLLSRAIRSVATGNRWIGPTKSIKTDFTGPLHWFPVGANWIARLSQKVDRALQGQSISVVRADFRNSVERTNEIGIVYKFLPIRTT